mmetsp:Transcript_59212/g.155922  ORF Transcript_59212/g.155922 Transcript_59212/m.155922 type:complete len:217 (+) Transcript_59212:186-836(+)
MELLLLLLLLMLLLRGKAAHKKATHAHIGAYSSLSVLPDLQLGLLHLLHGELLLLRGHLHRLVLLLSLQLRPGKVRLLQLPPVLVLSPGGLEVRLDLRLAVVLLLLHFSLGGLDDLLLLLLLLDDLGLHRFEGCRLDDRRVRGLLLLGSGVADLCQQRHVRCHRHEPARRGGGRRRDGERRHEGGDEAGAHRVPESTFQPDRLMFGSEWSREAQKT